MSRYYKRVERLRKQMVNDKIGAYFITKLADIRWLSGFTGSTAYVIITPESALFATDGRYETQCNTTLSDFWELVIVKSYGDWFKEAGAKYGTVTFQPDAPVSLTTYMPDPLVDTDDIMQVLRIRKEGQEIAELKAEYLLAGNAFIQSLERWSYGQSEREWAALLEYNMKTLGAEKPSFETIVASGARGALPHGVASDKIIDPTDAVTVDFGSSRAYNSDYTRVIYNGNDTEVLKIIETVRVALEKSMEFVRPGVTGREVDAVAREYIHSRGYGSYFNHGLGHGVGVEVHEMPHISPRGSMVIEEGMVFTIEPGIYIPDKYGVRLEQTVAVNSSGCELLSFVLDKYVYQLN